MSEQEAGSSDDQRVSFRTVLADREFRALFLAQTLNLVGDQLARIAVAILVFRRTGSPLLTAATYAVTFLPNMIGGPSLAVYVDRLPKRDVLIVCNLVSLMLVAVLVVPALPIAAALADVGLVALMQSVFTAARSAAVAEALPDPASYAAASTLTITADQFIQVLGLAVGGVMVGLIGSHTVLTVALLFFAFSTLFTARSVLRRRVEPSVSAEPTARRSEIWTYLFTRKEIRAGLLISMIMLTASAAPEGLAVPYAASRGHGAIIAGLLTLSIPLGAIAGTVLLTRVLGNHRSERNADLVAAAGAAALALSLLHPPVAVAFLLWAVGGSASAIFVVINNGIAPFFPPAIRGQLFALWYASIMGSQALGSLISGLLADYVNPGTAIGIVGSTALFGALLVTVVRFTAKTFRHFGTQESALTNR